MGSTNNNNSTPSTATTTTSLEKKPLRSLFPPKPQHLPPHNQNGRLRQLQLLLLELLLRSGLLHLRQISKSFHQPTFGSIIRRHHHVTASPRRSSIVFVWGTCERNAAVFARYSGLLAGVNRRAD